MKSTHKSVILDELPVHRARESNGRWVTDSGPDDGLGAPLSPLPSSGKSGSNEALAGTCPSRRAQRRAAVHVCEK
jgi:hypothetical protein